ncbi:MAG: universal stress protein [Chloroflexota bacterium]
MNERILVPLDGSKVGEAALPYIEDLVTKFKKEIKIEVTLLQVISSLTYYVVAGEAGVPVPYTEPELAELKNRADTYLERMGKSLRDTGATVKTRVSAGDAAEEIIKTAEEINADMIAMSSHGRSGISRWAFGSVTAKVLRAGVGPILTVRAPKDTKNF